MAMCVNMSAVWVSMSAVWFKEGGIIRDFVTDMCAECYMFMCIIPVLIQQGRHDFVSVLSNRP